MSYFLHVVYKMYKGLIIAGARLVTEKLVFRYMTFISVISRTALGHGLTTLNKPKSREVSTNDGIITQNIFNAAVPTSIETK